MKVSDYVKLNSMTKYPSILTYHELGDKGRLKENLTYQDLGDTVLEGYEKVDGTNSRLIFVIEEGEVVDYFIGSREDLLYAKGDRIIQTDLGIVPTLIPVAEAFKYTYEERVSALKAIDVPAPTEVITLFFETYGGNLQAAKQYTSAGIFSCRLFDCTVMGEEIFTRVMDKSAEQIASWRDRGGQVYVTSAVLDNFAQTYSLGRVPLLFRGKASEIPATIRGMYEFMQAFRTTKVGIDSVGHAEGIVMRTPTRSRIMKARFEDYQRTLGLPKG